jgi:hypothetical protein
MTDTEWSPYVQGKRSFGIRTAHDNMGLGVLSGRGQFAAGAVVYGK